MERCSCTQQRGLRPRGVQLCPRLSACSWTFTSWSAKSVDLTFPSLSAFQTDSWLSCFQVCLSESADWTWCPEPCHPFQSLPACILLICFCCGAGFSLVWCLAPCRSQCPISVSIDYVRIVCFRESQMLAYHWIIALSEVLAVGFGLEFTNLLADFVKVRFVLRDLDKA